MFIGTLFTKPLEKRDRGLPTEHGDFGTELDVDEFSLDYLRGPKDFVHTFIAATLAKAIRDTGVPREYWYSTFTPEAQLMFGLPHEVNWK